MARAWRARPQRHSAGSRPSADEEAYLSIVEAARWEWFAAEAFFHSVTDPALIDYAVHHLTAAEKKYAYLIRKAREEGMRHPRVDVVP
ncbi:MAG: DUF2508 family protein [Clostridia bacterium]|nr:DUF2508 family protein [Clostridia bacterium]